jgi:hypothetical protein
MSTLKSPDSSPDAPACAAPPTPLRRHLRPARTFVARLREEAVFRVWSVASSQGRANRRALESLRGRHTGRRCFIMGNGPSLLKSDLNQLASEVTIVSNAHFLIWSDLNYVPTYLTVEDRLVAEDRADRLRSLSGLTKIYPFDLRTLLGPPDDSTLFVEFPRQYGGFPKFARDLTKRAFWGGTVSYLNLQLAAYLGCDPIVLIGFDHNYVVPQDQIKDSVIYSSTSDVNHIHPDYFGPGYRWHDPQVERMEQAYRGARRDLEAMGITVLNATVGGYLEVFDRAPLSAIL